MANIFSFPQATLSLFVRLIADVVRGHVGFKFLAGYGGGLWALFFFAIVRTRRNGSVPL